MECSNTFTSCFERHLYDEAPMSIRFLNLLLERSGAQIELILEVFRRGFPYVGRNLSYEFI
jgi:hypothetical protein